MRRLAFRHTVLFHHHSYYIQSVQPGDVSFERMGPATGTVCQALGEGFMVCLCLYMYMHAPECVGVCACG